MPPEPPQKRAEEVGLVRKPEHNKSRGFESLKQPERPKAKNEEVMVQKATPAQAKAEALKPKLDRIPVRKEGKIARKSPRGQARPL